MRYFWFVVDLVQSAQTVRRDELIAVGNRQEVRLGYFDPVRFRTSLVRWHAKLIIKALAEQSWVVGDVMNEMNRRFDELYVLANVVRHRVGLAAYHIKSDMRHLVSTNCSTN